MYEYNERNDIWLFENDHSKAIYDTDEGKAVLSLLESDDEDRTIRKEGVTAKQLENAFLTYWDARNRYGLHINGELKEFREVLA